MKHEFQFEQVAKVDVIQMTWPQYQIGECTYLGKRVRLTPKETELLSALLIRRGCIVSVNEMIEAVYPDPDDEPEYARGNVEQFSWRLRRKLPGLIETVWGRGLTIPIPA